MPWLVGVATLGVAAAAVAAFIGTAAPTVEPLPVAPVSFMGADPTTTGSADDARTLTSRVITAQCD